MKRNFLILLISIGAMVCLCTYASAGENEIILANGGEPESIDPHRTSGTNEARLSLGFYEGLCVRDPKTGLPTPGIAKSWETSKDGTVITFHLRKATWSDGVPVTAHDFEYSFKRILNPDTAAQYAWFAAMFIKGGDEYNSGKGSADDVMVKALNDNTLQVTLVGPLAYATDAMCHQSFSPVPRHVIEKHGDKWTLPENHVVNGPFMMDLWAPQDRIVQVKNPKYWDADNVSLTKVTYIATEDVNTSFNKYQAGEVDWVVNLIPLDQIEEVQLRDDYQASPQWATYYVSVNCQKAPFDNPLVRQAIAYGIDRETLVEEVTKRGEIPSPAMVPPNAGYARASGHNFNMEKAQKLLAEAGYPGGKGFPKFTYSLNTNEAHAKIAEYIQASLLENLNINMEIENMEFKTFLAFRRNHEYKGLARDGWLGDYQDPNTFLDMYVSDGGMNNSDYQSEEFDSLIKKAATMPAGKGRFDTLTKAEELLVTKDAAIIPLFHYVNQHMIDLDKWDGWYDNPMDVHNLKYVSLKK